MNYAMLTSVFFSLSNSYPVGAGGVAGRVLLRQLSFYLIAWEATLRASMAAASWDIQDILGAKGAVQAAPDHSRGRGEM